MFLTQSLLPNLLADRAADSPVRQIALISSRAGSIGDNTSGGVYAYRASKAGLNMMGRSLAVDLKDKGIAVSLHHPGIINTTGFVHGDNPLAVSAEFATGKCWEVMMKVDLDNTGRFWHRDGYELPW